MSPTELLVHDLSYTLANLNVKDVEQRRAIIERTLASLVRTVISQHEVEQFVGAQNDLGQLSEIQAGSRKTA